MMVHDIQKNVTRVIHFQGTAPKTLKEEMLQNVSQLKVIKRWWGVGGVTIDDFLFHYLSFSFIYSGRFAGGSARYAPRVTSRSQPVWEVKDFR